MSTKLNVAQRNISPSLFFCMSNSGPRWGGAIPSCHRMRGGDVARLKVLFLYRTNEIQQVVLQGFLLHVLFKAKPNCWVLTNPARL